MFAFVAAEHLVDFGLNGLFAAMSVRYCVGLELEELLGEI